MYPILLVRTRVLILFPFAWILVAMLNVESVVRGYRAYKDDLSPSVGDEFELEIEQVNRHDRYAVAMKVSGDIVCRSCASRVFDDCILLSSRIEAE